MNATIKTILIIAGTVLLIYGAYQLIIPENSIDLGITEIETQNNDNSYISIGIGLVVLLTAFLVKKK